jgi:hypothetical protein
MRHEIPTHLNVPDRFVLGLTATQAMQLMAAAACAYGLLKSAWAPLELRAALAALVLGLGLVLVLVRPSGRSPGAWLLLAVVYLLLPHRFVWRPCPSMTEKAEGTWAALTPRVGWLPPAGSDEGGPYVR